MIGKKQSVYSVMLALWAATSIYFDLKLGLPVFFQANFLSRICIILFLVSLNLFWLYGFYHLIISLWSYRLTARSASRSPGPLNQNQIDPPAVAVLFTTMNDFQEGPLESCLHLDYRPYDIYILDDSTDKSYQERIDKFILRNPIIKLIRRTTHNGFKAGNLNNALQQIHEKYMYFAVCDADTVLPTGFIREILPYFWQEQRIGFVQANQVPNHRQNSRFARSFNFNTELNWKHYVPVKEKYGFMMFYGHGAIIRTKAWQEAGGIPEIISEDLAFSSILRRKGYYGVLAKEVCCQEDFPATYRSLRKRSKRWFTGAIEYLWKYYPNFLKDKNISWVEKADVLIGSGRLLLALPFLVYVLIAGIALPLIQYYFNLNIPQYSILPENIYSIITKVAHKTNWSFDLSLIMFMVIYSQFLPVLIDLWKNPRRILKYISLFTYLCLSTMIFSSFDLLAYLFTKRTEFSVTGASSQSKETFFDRLLLNVEFIAGFILFCASVMILI